MERNKKKAVFSYRRSTWTRLLSLLLCMALLAGSLPAAVMAAESAEVETQLTDDWIFSEEETGLAGEEPGFQDEVLSEENDAFTESDDYLSEEDNAFTEGDDSSIEGDVLIEGNDDLAEEGDALTEGDDPSEEGDALTEGDENIAEILAMDGTSVEEGIEVVEGEEDLSGLAEEETEVLLPEVEETDGETVLAGDGNETTLTVKVKWDDGKENLTHGDVVFVLQKKEGSVWKREKELTLSSNNSWTASASVSGDAGDYRFAEKYEGRELTPYSLTTLGYMEVDKGQSHYLGYYEIGAKSANVVTTFTHTLKTRTWKTEAKFMDVSDEGLPFNGINAVLQFYDSFTGMWKTEGVPLNLTEMNDWKKTFKNVPIMKTADGKSAYRVRHLNEQGSILYAENDADRQINAARFQASVEDEEVYVTFKGVSYSEGTGLIANTTTTVTYSEPEDDGEKQNKNYSVKIVWDDRGAGYSHRTTRVAVVLQKKNGNGWTDVQELILNGNDGWSKSFNKVEIKKGDEYRVRERDPGGTLFSNLSVLEEGEVGTFQTGNGGGDESTASYEVSYQVLQNETIITNTRNDTTIFYAKLNWDFFGAENPDGVFPHDVTVELRKKELGQWVTKQELTLSKANNWEGAFRRVDREDGDEWEIREKDSTGEIIGQGSRGSFAVKEDGEEKNRLFIVRYLNTGREDSIAPAPGHSTATGLKIEIFNTLGEFYRRYVVQKVWEDGEEGCHHDPIKIKVITAFTVQGSHVVKTIGEAELSEENQWRAAFYNDIESEGSPMEFMVQESDLNGDGFVEISPYNKRDNRQEIDPKFAGSYGGMKDNERFSYEYNVKALIIRRDPPQPDLNDGQMEVNITLTNTRITANKTFSAKVNWPANVPASFKPDHFTAKLTHKEMELNVNEIVLNDQNNWEAAFDPVPFDGIDKAGVYANYEISLYDEDGNPIMDNVGHATYVADEPEEGYNHPVTIKVRQDNGDVNLVNYRFRLDSKRAERSVFSLKVDGKEYRVNKVWEGLPDFLEEQDIGFEGHVNEYSKAIILLQHKNPNGSWVEEKRITNVTPDIENYAFDYVTEEDNNFRVRELNENGQPIEEGGTIVLKTKHGNTLYNLKYKVSYGKAGSDYPGTFIVTNKFEGVVFPAEVKWKEGDDRANSVRAVLQVRSNGGSWRVIDDCDVVLNNENGWTASISSATILEDREYRVRVQAGNQVIEDGSSAVIDRKKYKITYATDENGKTLISLEQGNITYKVNAVWDVGALNVDNNRAPGSISVKLQHRENDNWTDKETKVLSADNNWQCTFEAAGDRDDNYRVVEVDRSNNVIKNGDRGVFNVRVNGREEGYDFNASVQFRAPQENEEGNGTFTIRNTFATQMITYRVTAKWEDENDRDDKRPDSIRVLLKAANRDNKELTLSGAGNVWNGSFAAVPERINGQAVNYSIDYNVPADYDYCNVLQDEDDDKKYVLTFVHHHKDDEEDENNNNQNNPDPNNPNVNPPGIGGVGIGAAFGKIAPYLAIGAAGAIIGTLGGLGGGGGDNNDGDDPDEKITVSGKLRWNHGNNPRDNWPGNVTVQLLADGAPVKDNYKYLDVNEDADYTSYSFNDVPKYNGAKVINYSVTTDTIKDYTEEYDGMNVTLTYTPGKTYRKVSLGWNDQNNWDGIRPQSVDVNLLSGGTTIETMRLSSENNWTDTFADLDDTEDGYSVEVVRTGVINGVDAEGTYAFNIEGTDVLGFFIRLTHTPVNTDITGQITWIDDNDKAKKRPSSVIVTLMARLENGETVDMTTVKDRDGNLLPDMKKTVKADDDWKVTFAFDTLPEAADGGRISWFLKQEAVSGYETTVDGMTVVNTYNPPEPPAFTTHSLLLSGSIGVNFFMKLPELAGVDYENSYVDFTVNGRTTRDFFDPDHRDVNGKGYYGFTAYITSVEMAEPITAVFHYGSGQTVQDVFSVKDYIVAYESVQSQFDETTTALVRAIADYGHYAQPVLSRTNNWTINVDYKEMDKYYTEAYDYDAVAAALPGSTYSWDIGDSDLTNMSFTLNLLSRTQIYAYLYFKEGYSGSIRVTVDGTPVTAVKQKTRYYALTPGISAHQMNVTHTIVAETDSGTATMTVTPLDYVYYMIGPDNKTDTRDAVSAIYYYYTATQAYRAAHPKGE